MFLKFYGIYNESEFIKEENGVAWQESDNYGSDFLNVRVNLNTNKGVLAYANFVQRNKFIVVRLD